MGTAYCGGEELPFTRSIRSRQSETVESAFEDKTYRFSSHLALVRGSIAGAIYIISDVTEERRAAKEKDEAFALLRALTDSAPVGFAFFDQEMRYRLVNQEMARTNETPVEAHIGHTPEEIVPHLAAKMRAAFQKVVETGEPLVDRELSDPAAGAPEFRSWLQSWYPVNAADGRLIGVGATVVETTEQTRAERARQDLERRMLDAQKLESIGLLAGGIAHDFNNLLTGVLGNASLAREMAPPGTALARCLGEIVNASERAAHLTKQMLAYSGKGQFFVELLDLSVETEDVVRLVQPSVSKKVSLLLDFSKDLPGVRADKGQLQQVVMNLMVNAAEAIGDAAGLLSVQTGQRGFTAEEIGETLPGSQIAPGHYVYIEVRDTGCGMDEDTKARIFDPFFTTKFTGRGLGLAAVGGIVRGHKGAIHVTSAPGKGSTFVVYFPAAGERTVFPQATHQESASTSGNCGTVLVVDDEALVLRTARTALQRIGCTVLTAESGPAAIDVFRRHIGEISLIILDLSMPGMSGLEVLPELRKLRPDVHVVVSSGYSESETLRLFSGHTISGFLQKPYTSQRLVERVSAATAGS